MREERNMERSSERTRDEALLDLSRSRPEAFGAFYRRHENAMLLFFLRRTASAETAADLTAEVFAAALESVGRFHPQRGSAVAWLYGIANNKLAASRRRGQVEDQARRRLRMEPLVLDDEALERVEALADSQRSAALLADLLSALPVEQHEAVRARVLEERPYQLIAQELRCSPAVIRQRVSRGLKSLRAGLPQENS